MENSQPECSYVLLQCFIISRQHSYSISPFSKKCLGSQSIVHCDCVFAGQPRAAGNSGAGGGEHPGSTASFSPRSTPPAGKTRRPGPEPSCQLLSTDGPTAGGCAERKKREKEGGWLTAVLARLHLSGSFSLLCSQQGGRGHAFVSVILVNSCLFFFSPIVFFFLFHIFCFLFSLPSPCSCLLFVVIYPALYANSLSMPINISY